MTDARQPYDPPRLTPTGRIVERDVNDPPRPHLFHMHKRTCVYCGVPEWGCALYDSTHCEGNGSPVVGPRAGSLWCRLRARWIRWRRPARKLPTLDVRPPKVNHD